MDVSLCWRTLGGTVLFWLATLAAIGGVGLGIAAANPEFVGYVIGRWLGTVAIVFLLQGAWLKLRGRSGDGGDEATPS